MTLAHNVNQQGTTWNSNTIDWIVDHASLTSVAARTSKMLTFTQPQHCWSIASKAATVISLLVLIVGQ